MKTICKTNTYHITITSGFKILETFTNLSWRRLSKTYSRWLEWFTWWCWCIIHMDQWKNLFFQRIAVLEILWCGRSWQWVSQADEPRLCWDSHQCWRCSGVAQEQQNILLQGVKILEAGSRPWSSCTWHLSKTFEVSIILKGKLETSLNWDSFLK